MFFHHLQQGIMGWFSAPNVRLFRRVREESLKFLYQLKWLMGRNVSLNDFRVCWRQWVYNRACQQNIVIPTGRICTVKLCVKRSEMFLLAYTLSSFPISAFTEKALYHPRQVGGPSGQLDWTLDIKMNEVSRYHLIKRLLWTYSSSVMSSLALKNIGKGHCWYRMWGKGTSAVLVFRLCQNSNSCPKLVKGNVSCMLGRLFREHTHLALVRKHTHNLLIKKNPKCW